ncbi:MAG: hypothetical protein ACXWDE_12750 [Aeromicrobium sp.]
MTRLLILTLWLTAASPVMAQGVILDRVVAVVGDSPVLLSDVRLLVEFQLVDVPPGVDPEQAALDRLIERRLMFDEVDRYGPLEPDPARIAERLADLTSRLGDRLDRTYARTGINEDRLRSLVVQLLRIDDYVEQRFGAAAQPTDDEVARFYAEHPGQFTVDGRLRPFAEVEADARARLTADRRSRLVREWVHSIERRTPVRVIQ